MLVRDCPRNRLSLRVHKGTRAIRYLVLGRQILHTSLVTEKMKKKLGKRLRCVKMEGVCV